MTGLTKREILESTIRLAEKVSRPSSKAKLLADVGLSCLKQGAADLAEAVRTKLKEQGRKVGLPKVDLHDQLIPIELARLSAAMGLRQEADLIFAEVIGAAQNLPKMIDKCAILYRIVQVYIDLGEPERALAVANSVVDANFRSTVLNGAVGKYIDLGDLDSALRIVEQMPEGALGAHLLAEITLKAMASESISAKNENLLVRIHKTS